MIANALDGSKTYDAPGWAARCGLPIMMFLVSSVGFSQSDESFQLASGFPLENSQNVSTSIAINLRFNQPVDPDSLEHLKLFATDGTEMRCRKSTDLTNASITLVPRDDLKPLTQYTCRGTEGVLSQDGQPLVPFSRTFTTGRVTDVESAQPTFELETFDGTRSMTTILFGPDRRLYAADAFGHLVRWGIDEQGRPHDRTVLMSDPKESRQYIDLEWDPSATAENLVLWASFSERLAQRDDRFYFTGTIVRIELGDKICEQTIVHGLPHGRERQGGFDTLPHQPNGLVFRDGKLYQSVGSTSSSGGPPNWGNPEQAFSGCILEYDYRVIDAPLDVHPNSNIDPSAPNSPVKIFATGVRNALEIVSHSNGHLYTATNINDRAGPRDGVPDDPEIPGDQNTLIKGTTPDHESLFLLQRGRHYGFPNPSRGQFVLHGGNPTPQEDPFEISDYPVGTQPENGFAPELMFQIWQDGGTSANGMLEYQPETPYPLSGCLLSCFYSAKKIAAIRLGEDGLPVNISDLRAVKNKLAFNGPLDITQDTRTGILYIADFGTQSKFGADGSLKLLRPSRPAKKAASITIALIGDSTVEELSGWGEPFRQRFTDDVKVLNFAKGGASSKSWYEGNRMPAVLAAKPDIVLIQFGHNDQPGKGPARETAPETTYREYLARYVAEARSIGARPIIISSVTRRRFDANNKIQTTLTPWAKAANSVASELNVPFIDLHQLSIQHHNRIGPEASMKFNYKDGDLTHFNRTGGAVIADMVITELKSVVPTLKRFIRNQLDPID